MAARRFSQSSEDMTAPREALRHSVECAQRIQHDNVAKVFGYSESEDEILVLMERVEGLNLHQLIQHCRNNALNLDPRLSIWLIRELVRVLNELRAQQSAGNPPPFQLTAGLSLERVVATHAGQLKIIDMAKGSATPVVEQLDRMLTMLSSLFSVSDSQVPTKDGHIDSQALCSEITNRTYSGLDALETMLEKVFYRTYFADDEQHGAQELKKLVSKICGEPTQPKHIPKTTDKLAATKGELTRVLESRHQPVVPQALTYADRVTGLETRTTERAPEIQTLDAHKDRLSAPQASAQASRIIWFTIGFVCAIATMVLYLSVFMSG